MGWRCAHFPGKISKYDIAYIDVSDGHASFLTAAQREIIPRDINRWAHFSLLSITNLRPFCSDYKTKHAALMDVRYQILHSNGALFDTLVLEIDLDLPEKTGLYATRLARNTASRDAQCLKALGNHKIR